MLPLILASTFLFSCNEADAIIRNVWQNEFISIEDQEGIIDSMLEVTPPECSAHYYNE